MKTQFEKTLDEASKSLRMRATWTLKAKTVDLSGVVLSTTWDRMSKHDQDFNLVWNEIYGDCKDLSLPKLKKVMDFVRTL
jgi:hypothetical protein